VTSIHYNGVDADGNGKLPIAKWGDASTDTSDTPSDYAGVGSAYGVIRLKLPVIMDYVPLWANHDICALDTGERYLEKSEPVPVYE
jgi:hypothetical protein